MRSLIVCCLVALAVCQSFTYANHLKQNRVYEYDYVAEVRVGATSEELPASALKISSRVKITGDSEPKYYIQFSDVKLEGLNGLQGKDQFQPMESLEKRIANEFGKPFAFNYQNGHLTHITAPPGVSTMVKNIARGPLDLLALTVKSDLSVYELVEASIYGTCKSDYIQRKDRNTGVVTLQRTIDLQSCSERAAVTTGLASAVPNALSKMVGRSIETSVRYNYTLDAAQSDPVLREAHAQENQQATPFNLKNGHLSSRAKKSLTLVKVTDKYHPVICGDMEYAGELMYKLENVNLNIPIVMQELDQPVQKAQQLLEKLAQQVNNVHIAKGANLDYLALYELYRAMNAADVDHLWVSNKDVAARRALFLSTITESADMKLINFIAQRLQASDLNALEASQLVVVALNHVSVTPEIIDKAKEMLKLSPSQINVNVWRALVLGYGSMVFRHSIVKKSCSASDITPLMILANKTIHEDQFPENAVVTVLKGLGNSGCPASLKWLRSLYFNPMGSRSVTPRILFSALQSVRLMANIDAAKVQAFTRDVFVNEKVSTELRMLAVKQLIETRPKHELMNVIVQTLLATEDEILGVFAYSYLKGFARSKTPDNLVFSSEANVAASILSSRYQEISSKYNRAFRMDDFSNDLLMGQAASQFILNAMESKIPQHIILSLTSLGIGRVLPLAEMGSDLHGLSDILQNLEPDTLASFISKLESSPSSNFTLSFYWQIFGQELFFIDVTNETISSIKRTVLEVLRGGGRFQSLKPFMVFEVRHVQANCLGLPMEFSKYYHSITKVDVIADPPISPLHANRTVILGSRGSVSMDKEFWTFFGINTHMFQCAAELKTEMSVLVPWEVRVKLDISERKYSLEVPLPAEPIDLVNFRSKTHATIRAWGGEERKIEIFPSVENDQDNNLKCHALVSDMKICTKSLLSGTEGEFTGHASFFFTPKVLLVRVVPEASNATDKVRISIDLRPDQSQSTETGGDVALLAHLNRDRAPNSETIPIFIAKIVAMKGNQEITGWKLKGFNWKNRPLYDVSFILSKIGSIDKWMMCVDTMVPNLANAEIRSSFGSHCEPYKISLKSETKSAAGALNVFSLILKWGQLPENILELAKRIAPRIPGILYMKGFERYERTNNPQEIVAQLIPTIQHYRNLELDFPEATYVLTDVILWLRGLVGEETYAALKKAAEIDI